jgi:hypothetical protein
MIFTIFFIRIIITMIISITTIIFINAFTIATHEFIMFTCRCSSSSSTIFFIFSVWTIINSITSALKNFVNILFLYFTLEQIYKFTKHNFLKISIFKNFFFHRIPKCKNNKNFQNNTGNRK